MSDKMAISAKGGRHRQQHVLPQMDLFGGAQGASDTPSWKELPPDAQEVLVGLITQLMLDHARLGTTSGKMEVDRDL